MTKPSPTTMFKTLILATAIGATLPATAAQTRETTITLIEINDLHANLVGHKDLVRNPDGSTSVVMKGGLARIKTLIDEMRRENANTVVMNIGDTFHGGVEAFYTLGNAVADPINALGIDVGVPGNWDYYFTPAVTRARYGRVEEEIAEVSFPRLADPIPIKRPDYPNLGANVRDVTDSLPEDFLPPTHIIEHDGVKIGFIGFTSDIVELMHPMLAQGMDFAWGREEHLELLLQHARRLRQQGADIVAVMSELGIHKDIALSEALADRQQAGEIPAGLVDVFFAAHTHEATMQPITSTEDGTKLYAPVVEAGNDGYLGRMDITMAHDGSTSTGGPRNRTTEEHWSVSEMAWELMPVDASVPEDPQMKALVEAERAPFLDPDVDLMAVPFVMQRLEQPIDTVIGHLAPGSVVQQDNGLAGVLSRHHSLSSTFNRALTEMLLDMTGTDVALSPGFRMGATIPEAGFVMENEIVASGDITLEDAYRFFPMYYGLATGTTSGKHLKEVINASLDTTYSSDTWNTQGGWNYGYAGITTSVNLESGDRNRIMEVRLDQDGSQINDGDTLTVAGCRRLPIDFEGTLCGISGFNDVTLVRNPTTGRPWSLIDVFTHMLQNEGYPLRANGSNVHDYSQTQLWPEAEFVQPLEGVGESHIPHNPDDPCGFFKWNCVNN